MHTNRRPIPMFTKVFSEAPRGQQVIAEAARLLRGMRFSADNGALTDGQYVGVTVDPWANDDGRTFRALITCYAFGHQRVDWDGHHVRVERENAPRSGVWLARFDAHGHAFFPALEPANYRATLHEHVPLDENGGEPDGGARILTPSAGAATSASTPVARLCGEPRRAHRLRVWSGRTRNRKLRWTAEETEEGDVQLEFVTSSSELAGHVVAFSLLDPATRAQACARQLTLEPSRGTSRAWKGSCSLGSGVNLAGPHELLVELHPPSAKRETR